MKKEEAKENRSLCNVDCERSHEALTFLLTEGGRQEIAQNERRTGSFSGTGPASWVITFHNELLSYL